MLLKRQAAHGLSWWRGAERDLLLIKRPWHTVLALGRSAEAYSRVNIPQAALKAASPTGLSSLNSAGEAKGSFPSKAPSAAPSLQPGLTREEAEPSSAGLPLGLGLPCHYKTGLPKRDLLTSRDSGPPAARLPGSG